MEHLKFGFLCNLQWVLTISTISSLAIQIPIQLLFWHFMITSLLFKEWEGNPEKRSFPTLERIGWLVQEVKTLTLVSLNIAVIFSRFTLSDDSLLESRGYGELYPVQDWGEEGPKVVWMCLACYCSFYCYDIFVYCFWDIAWHIILGGSHCWIFCCFCILYLDGK